MDNLNDLLVGTIPLLAVVFGLVEFIKKLGVTGKLLTVLSMVIGVILGILYQLSIKIPTNYTEWFVAAIFGLAIGLAASGFYDFISKRTVVQPVTPAEYKPWIPPTE